MHDEDEELNSLDELYDFDHDGKLSMSEEACRDWDIIENCDEAWEDYERIKKAERQRNSKYEAKFIDGDEKTSFYEERISIILLLVVTALICVGISIFLFNIAPGLIVFAILAVAWLVFSLYMIVKEDRDEILINKDMYVLYIGMVLLCIVAIIVCAFVRFKMEN